MRKIWPTVLLVVGLVACRGPAGFWGKYRGRDIVERYSDQGPWGGSRWILWQAQPHEPFVADQVLSFAAEHGWRCDGGTAYSSAEVSNWVAMGRPVFPLLYGLSAIHTSDVPRQITGDSRVYRCSTGWIRVDAGTGETSEINGYIHIESGGSKLAVYHLWGE